MTGKSLCGELVLRTHPTRCFAARADSAFGKYSAVRLLLCTGVAKRVKSAEAIRKRPGRTEFQRAIVQRETEGPLAGEWTARITGSQGAGILRSLSEANALLVLGHEQGSVAAGEPVEVWMFEGLV